MTDPWAPTPRSEEDQAKDKIELDRLWDLVRIPLGNWATDMNAGSLARLMAMPPGKRDEAIVKAALGWLIANDIIAPHPGPAGDPWYPVDMPAHLPDPSR